MTVKKLTMQFAMLLLLSAALTACGNFEWFPDNTTTATTPSGSAPQTPATPTTTTKTQMGGAIQGTPLALTTAVTTFAGSTYFADGTGTAARFDLPSSVTSDGTNLYVADTMNNTIRKIVIATGVVTTLAGNAAGGLVTTDGTGTAAHFYHPAGITTDGPNLYVADSGNCTVRKIVIATGVVTTLAGTGQSAGFNDGVGTAARFRIPSGITIEGASLYVADNQNHTIRKIVIATGEVTTLAGTPGASGTTDGTGATARFNLPESLTSDGTNLYVADSGNWTIRKIVIATGAVTTLAGTAGSPGSTDGVGTAARFSSPSSITTDGSNLYIADSGDGTIRKLVIATSEVTTVAGSSGKYGSTDGTGATARFMYPKGLALADNSLYVADSMNNTIRKLMIATGQVTTLAGSAGKSLDGIGAVARFNDPGGVTTDGTSLYVADSGNSDIRKIVIATGAVTTLAGSSGQTGSADGTGTAVRFYNPRGITTDGTNLYVADTQNHIIRRIVIATGAVTTLAGTAGQSGSADGVGVAAHFNSPVGITTDNVNLYVADTNNHTIRKIVIATGEVKTLAGTAGQIGSADGATAHFNFPEGVTTDGTTLYVSDYFNSSIRKIDIATGVVSTVATSVGPSAWITSDGTYLYCGRMLSVIKVAIATGTVTTLAGSMDVPGSVNGTGTAARFSNHFGGVTDGISLYVVDGGNNTIRKIQ